MTNLSAPPQGLPPRGALAEDAWIGCPHCTRPIDIRAQVAKARSDIADWALHALHNEDQGHYLIHPLELLYSACQSIEDSARMALHPLSLLDAHIRPRRSVGKENEGDDVRNSEDRT